jgi:hypothetical protein
VVFVYLNGYSYILCRLDSGGEASLKATFLATTLGLRRLLNLWLYRDAISIPKFFCSFSEKINFEIKKTDCIQGIIRKVKILASVNKISIPKCVCFLRKIPQLLRIFTQLMDKEGDKG